MRGQASLRDLKSYVQENGLGPLARKRFNSLVLSSGARFATFKECLHVLAGGGVEVPKSLLRKVGPRLCRNGDVTSTVPTAEALRGAKQVAFFHTWSKCPPCKEFKKKLVAFSRKHARLAVVHVPFDQEENYKDYFREGDPSWYGILPGGGRAKKLEKAHGIKSVPVVVVYDVETGKRLTRMGRYDIAEGKPFPLAQQTSFTCPPAKSNSCVTREGCRCTYQSCPSAAEVICKKVSLEKRMPAEFGWAGPGNDLVLCTEHRRKLYDEHRALYNVDEILDKGADRCMMRLRVQGSMWGERSLDTPCELGGTTTLSGHKLEDLAARLEKHLAPAVRERLGKGDSVRVCAKCLKKLSESDGRLWMWILAGLAGVGLGAYFYNSSE